MSNENPISNNEFQNIKKYIAFPLDRGLWETLFIINSSNEFVKYIENLNLLYTPINQNNIFQKIEYLYNNPLVLNDENYQHKIKSIMSENKINIEKSTINGDFFTIINNFNLNNNIIMILSINKNISLKLEDIFNKIDYAKLYSRKKTFSKNTLLIPYFFYTNIISRNIFSNQIELDYFNQGKYYYDMQQHEESIRMLGKAFEATLKNIYETLFREDSSNISSIGKLLNNIEYKLKEITNSLTQQQTNINNLSRKLFKKCKDLEKNTPNSPQKIINEFKELAREIEKIEKQKNTSSESIFFPEHIKKHLEKLQYFRNRVAHHNNTNYFYYNDSLDMLFSYIQLYLWWKEACCFITNWDNNKKDIIEEFIKLKNNSNIQQLENFLSEIYIPPPLIPKYQL